MDTLFEQDAEIGSTFYLELLACSWRNYPVPMASTPDSLHTSHTSVLSAQNVPQYCINFLPGDFWIKSQFWLLFLPLSDLSYTIVDGE